MNTEECIEWRGHPSFRNEQALIGLVENGYRIWPWSWTEPNCGTEQCIEPAHQDVSGPQALDYRPYICVYCGDPADTRDHILPTALTGKSRRRHVLTVPACRECNSAIGATVEGALDLRRAIAQGHIRRKHHKALRVPDYTPDEVNEFEGALRESVVASLAKKAWIASRLAFPDDPDFDLRALQSSGIENPFSSGLLSGSARNASQEP